VVIARTVALGAEGLVSGCAQIVLYFACALILDHGLGAFASLGATLEALRTNFGGLAMLGLLGWIGMAIGAELYVVPAFLFLPIQWASLEIAYRKVSPLAAGG